MDLGLAGKRAVVVGASRGIGRAVAVGLAEEGCHVAVCARREVGVAEITSAIAAKGVTAIGRALDVTDLQTAREWVGEVAATLGGLDVLVWCVSAQSRDWVDCFRTDIAACVNLVEAAVPSLEASGQGAIVGIASQAASLAVPDYKAYSAIKAALVSYLASLARELASRGVRVNAVSPGEVFDEGGIWGRIRRERPDRYEAALRKNIRGRLGTPEEVARVVVFVSSPVASLISGANVLVDGMGRDFLQL